MRNYLRALAVSGAAAACLAGSSTAAMARPAPHVTGHAYYLTFSVTGDHRGDRADIYLYGGLGLHRSPGFRRLPFSASYKLPERVIDGREFWLVDAEAARRGEVIRGQVVKETVTRYSDGSTRSSRELLASDTNAGSAGWDRRVTAACRLCNGE